MPPEDRIYYYVPGGENEFENQPLFTTLEFAQFCFILVALVYKLTPCRKMCLILQFDWMHQVSVTVVQVLDFRQAYNLNSLNVSLSMY